MTKLNWRDASKELPNYEKSDLYFVITSKRPSFDIAKFDGENFWINDVEYGSVNLRVEFWLLIEELPIPEE